MTTMSTMPTMYWLCWLLYWLWWLCWLWWNFLARKNWLTCTEATRAKIEIKISKSSRTGPHSCLYLLLRLAGNSAQIGSPEASVSGIYFVTAAAGLPTERPNKSRVTHTHTHTASISRLDASSDKSDWVSERVFKEEKTRHFCVSLRGSPAKPAKVPS